MPEPGWRPDPAWGAAPAGWIFRPNDARKAQTLAAVNAVLIGLVGAVYGAILSSQGNGPAYWFVAVLAIAVGCAVVVAFGGQPTAMLVNLVIVGACVVLGILSIGLLLMPAFVASLASYRLGSRARRPGR